MPHKLLLADDSITIQKVVELVLAEEDFEIKSVSNGEDALNAVGSFGPDVVLADIEMPKMNGYQLCEKIKQNPATSHIPVILLAGAFEPVDTAVAGKVGADDSVVKPFESQELISKLNAALTLSATASVMAGGQEGDEAIAIAEDSVQFADDAVEIADAGGEDLWALEDAEEVVAVEAEPGGQFDAEEALTVDDAVSAEEPFAVAEEEPFALADEEIFEITEEEPFAAADEEISPEPVPVVEEVPVQEPPRAYMPERPVTAQAAMPQIVVPSREEILASCRASIDSQVAAALSSLDIRESLISALMPSLKDSIEKILWEIAPDLTEKMLKEILKSSVASLTTQVEKVIWETVPDLAGTMISREIEKIKSEF